MNEKILDLLESVCEDDIVKEELDLNLFDEGLLDSLALVELIVGIETNFGITLSPTEVKREDIETPNKLINYLNELGIK